MAMIVSSTDTEILHARPRASPVFRSAPCEEIGSRSKSKNVALFGPDEGPSRLALRILPPPPLAPTGILPSEDHVDRRKVRRPSVYLRPSSGRLRAGRWRHEAGEAPPGRRAARAAGRPALHRGRAANDKGGIFLAAELYRLSPTTSTPPSSQVLRCRQAGRQNGLLTELATSTGFALTDPRTKRHFLTLTCCRFPHKDRIEKRAKLGRAQRISASSELTTIAIGPLMAE